MGVGSVLLWSVPSNLVVSAVSNVTHCVQMSVQTARWPIHMHTILYMYNSYDSKF